MESGKPSPLTKTHSSQTEPSSHKMTTSNYKTSEFIIQHYCDNPRPEFPTAEQFTEQSLHRVSRILLTPNRTEYQILSNLRKQLPMRLAHFRKFRIKPEHDIPVPRMVTESFRRNLILSAFEPSRSFASFALFFQERWLV